MGPCVSQIAIDGRTRWCCIKLYLTQKSGARALLDVGVGSQGTHRVISLSEEQSLARLWLLVNHFAGDVSLGFHWACVHSNRSD